VCCRAGGFRPTSWVAVCSGVAVFTISYAASVAEDLGGVRAFERRRLLDQIDRQLSHEPTREARNRKVLRGLTPPWEHVQPVWELRVNEYRVFYDVDEVAEQVVVRAVRRKPPHKATEEIL
jgi:mRNA-degrading endonuclease RelE of RelBE toxin-antitoxin system